MVGKATLPNDAEHRDDLMGASMPSHGLNAVDQEREGSMADEGGTSGAVMEAQDRDILRDPTSHLPYSTRAQSLARRHRKAPPRLLILLGVGVMLSVGFLALVALSPRRTRYLGR